MIFLKIFKPLGADFVVYNEAAKMLFAGLNPYAGLITRTFPFNYPPTSLLFLWPLGFLDYQTANVIWNVLSMLSILVSIWLVCKIGQIEKIWLGPLALLFTFFFFPTKFNLGNGQINAFLLLFCVLSLYFYQKSRKNFSAFWLALATGIKFAPAIFILYFVIRRDWRQVFRFFSFLFSLVGFSFWLIPAAYQLVYFRDILPLSFTSAAKDWYYNQSLWGFLARSVPPVQFLFYPLAIFILLLTWYRGRVLSWKRALAAVSCLYLLIHPIALQHYFVFALIPWILLLDRRDWISLTGTYLLLAVDVKNFNAVPREFYFLLSHDFYGILALWVLALWREKFWKIAAHLWIFLFLGTYVLNLACRGGFC